MAITFSQPLLTEEEEAVLHNVFVRSLDGKTLCFQINPQKEVNLHEFKQRVWTKLRNENADLVKNVAFSNVFLTRGGKSLDVLDNYYNKNIDSQHSSCCLFSKDGVVLDLHYRNLGGCFMITFSILCMIALACLSSFCTCGLSLCVVPFLLPLVFILPLFCL